MVAAVAVVVTVTGASPPARLRSMCPGAVRKWVSV